MKMMIALDRDELNALQFPVVVEMWDKVRGSMSKRRQYNKEFDEKERAVIRRYYNLFYSWYLRKGTPESAVMTLATYNLIQRACNFFGGI
jgi:hypothetical protein